MFRAVIVVLLCAACKQSTDLDAGVDASSHTLPCDVRGVFESNCQGCHGEPPQNGAPMSLLTYDDVMRTDATGERYIDLAIARMQDPAKPMPPPPALAATPAQIDTLKAWVAAHTPAATPSDMCGSPPPPPPPPPPPNDPLNDAPTCTSGQMWTGGDTGSPVMHPGAACLYCHEQTSTAPRFAISGTVYPTGHEPTDCNGTSAATVIVTDANGVMLTLTPNAAGNFYYVGSVAFPIHAKLVAGGKERVMPDMQNSGDCNFCHQQVGVNKAPGRITLPY